MDVDVDGPGPAFVAVNQTWHPGWQATVDGARARVVRTDLSLSGLVVPPGRHTVDLAFDDPSVTAGMLLGLAGLAACAVLLLTSRRVAGVGTVSSGR
jgi:uncharacterized membrane protein YfhO